MAHQNAVQNAAKRRLDVCGFRLRGGADGLVFGENALEFRCHAFHDAAATGRTAGARGSIADILEVVIDGEFFAGFDRAQTHVNDVALHDARDHVGLTTVIDDFRAAAAEGAIEGPVFVEREQVGVLALAALLGFAAIEAFAGVLDHLAVGGDAFFGVDAETVNLGFANREFVAGVLGINAGTANRSIHAGVGNSCIVADERM